jgi:hypothetical protein
LLVRWLERHAAYGLMLCVLGTAPAQEIPPAASPDLAAEVKMPSFPEAGDDAADAPQSTPASAPADAVASTPANAPADAVANTPASAPADAVASPPAASAAGVIAPIALPALPPAASVVPAADTVPPPSTGPHADVDKYHWLDKARQEVYDAVWHSSMRVDRWFGSAADEDTYQKGAYGSLAPAVLWDQYSHFRELLRFNANFPLPAIDQRLHAFIGRVNPEEYITERDEPSGAFQRQYGPATEDQTIFGLAFHTPSRQGGYFDAGAGVRISLPMNPYVKGSYVYERGSSDIGLFSLRETAFWDRPDGFGVTQRIDMERIYELRWLLRWTGSATYAQYSQGLRGYMAMLAMRGFPDRRAVAMEISIDGATDAPVPLHDYGLKVAYRKAVVRRWLIMELRTSVDWPRDFVTQRRGSSFGVGIGFEMLFGTEEFLARPVTF